MLLVALLASLAGLGPPDQSYVSAQHEKVRVWEIHAPVEARVYGFYTTKDQLNAAIVDFFGKLEEPEELRNKIVIQVANKPEDVQLYRLKADKVTHEIITSCTDGLLIRWHYDPRTIRLYSASIFYKH